MSDILSILYSLSDEDLESMSDEQIILMLMEIYHPNDHDLNVISINIFSKSNMNM